MDPFEGYERIPTPPEHGLPGTFVYRKVHDHKGYSVERCVRCGWVMGMDPLNCNNDNTPHIFPSQLEGAK